MQTSLRSFINRVYEKSLSIIVHRWQLQFSLNKSLSIAFAQFYRCVWMAIAQFGSSSQSLLVCGRAHRFRGNMSEDERGGHREQLQDFIENYRNEICLWKTTCKDYHDRNKKNAAYNRLVEKYKSIDPNATRDIVVKKINNLRTTYKKELNKIKQSCKSGAGTDEIYKPRLWYFELLSFLYDQEVPRPSTSNIDEDENEVSFYF